MSRIVVTGATGNVGTALVARLLGAGHQVVALARREPEPQAGVEFLAVDLTRDDDVPVLREAVRGADAVVHLAWGFQPSHRLDLLAELGVGGTTRVAEAVVAEGVPHLVHMSSVGTYSPRVDLEPVDEHYPRDGVPSSPYSSHKAAAERVLDRLQADHPDLLVTRTRPGIIVQRQAGSALLRYGVPGYVPAALLAHLPLLPLDGRLHLPVVHTDDVAEALATAVERRATGPFNLATATPASADDVAAAFGATRVPVPAPVIRASVSGLWHARLLQLDPGWIDLAFAVPVMDSGRAQRELDWTPQVSTAQVLEELVAGLSSRASGSTPVLRPRTAYDGLRRLVQQGPVSRRRTP